jgi:hypothetical protein
MRRQINADELGDFYRLIGKAIWHVQHLEDVMVTFLAVKIIYEDRCAGNTATAANAQVLLEAKRKITLGPLIESCRSRKIIRLEHQPRFETFRLERHWLVHQSMIESGDDLYLDATRYVTFKRIEAVGEEAISLKKLVFGDYESWMVSHGVDTTAASQLAEKQLRTLKGL